MPARPGASIGGVSRAEVYEAPEGPRSTELAVFGCAYRNGRAFQLGGVASQQSKGGPGGEKRVLDATLASTVVAYAKSWYNETGGSRDVVIVRDLRTGRILHEVLTGTRAKPDPATEGVGAVQALVVKSDGSVAWTVAADHEEGTYQVHAVDKTGSRTLATGADIAPARGLRQHDVLDAGGNSAVGDAELRTNSPLRAARDRGRLRPARSVGRIPSGSGRSAAYTRRPPLKGREKRDARPEANEADDHLRRGSRGLAAWELLPTTVHLSATFATFDGLRDVQRL